MTWPLLTSSLTTLSHSCSLTFSHGALLPVPSLLLSQGLCTYSTLCLDLFPHVIALLFAYHNLSLSLNSPRCPPWSPHLTALPTSDILHHSVASVDLFRTLLTPEKSVHWLIYCCLPKYYMSSVSAGKVSLLPLLCCQHSVQCLAHCGSLADICWMTIKKGNEFDVLTAQYFLRSVSSFVIWRYSHLELTVKMKSVI